MPEADSSTPLAAALESNRAVLQEFAERVDLLVPGASLLHEQNAFVERVVDSVKQGFVAGGQPT